MSSCSSNLTEHSSYDYMYILETALYTDAVVGTWTAGTRSRDTTCYAHIHLLACAQLNFHSRTCLSPHCREASPSQTTNVPCDRHGLSSRRHCILMRLLAPGRLRLALGIPLAMLISISWRVLNLTSTQGNACLLTEERHHRLRPQMSLVTVTGYPRDGLIR